MANILVTGGARGIGAGIVKALAAAGHDVGFCGRGEPAKAEGLLDELRRKFSGKFIYYRCDVSLAEDRKKRTPGHTISMCPGTGVNQGSRHSSIGQLRYTAIPCSP